MVDGEEERRRSLIICLCFLLPAADIGRTESPEPEHSMNVTVIPAKAGIPQRLLFMGGDRRCHPRESGDPCMESVRNSCSSPSA